MTLVLPFSVSHWLLRLFKNKLEFDTNFSLFYNQQFFFLYMIKAHIKTRSNAQSSVDAVALKKIYGFYNDMIKIIMETEQIIIFSHHPRPRHLPTRTIFSLIFVIPNFWQGFPLHWSSSSSLYSVQEMDIFSFKILYH